MIRESLILDHVGDIDLGPILLFCPMSLFVDSNVSFMTQNGSWTSGLSYHLVFWILILLVRQRLESYSIIFEQLKGTALPGLASW